MTKKGKKGSRFDFRLSDEDMESLTRLAYKMDISKSHVIAKLIKEADEKLIEEAISDGSYRDYVGKSEE